MKIEEGHFLWRNILEVEASLVSAREKRLGQKLKRKEKNMTILSYLSGWLNIYLCAHIFAPNNPWTFLDAGILNLILMNI